MTRIQIFRGIMFMAALAAAASAFAAEVIPHPNAIPLEPVGERLTPAQEKLIEGAWCRNPQIRNPSPATFLSPQAINEEYRFRKKKASVFSAYFYSPGIRITTKYSVAGIPDIVQDEEPLSKTRNVQITIDKDGLFVVTAYESSSEPYSTKPFSKNPDLGHRQSHSLHRGWYKIQNETMRLMYREDYDAGWRYHDVGTAPGTSFEVRPYIDRRPKEQVGDWDGRGKAQPGSLFGEIIRNDPWKRCDRLEDKLRGLQDAGRTPPPQSGTQGRTSGAAATPPNRPAGSPPSSHAGASSTADRVALACGDDVCCRTWYGEGKHGFDDLGIEACRGYAPLYRNLDFWCSAKGNAPDFCQDTPAPAWAGGGGSGQCFPPNVAEEIPTHRGAQQPKYWIVWDPVVGAFGAPYAIAGLEKGLDEVAADNRSDCRQRGGERCYYSGGCINQPTGVAVPEDRSWAFVACAASSEQAMASAKSKCELATRCSCEAEDAGRLDSNSWFLPVRTEASGNCTASRHPVTESGWDVCSICREYRACLEGGGSPSPDGPGMDLNEVRSICDNPYRMNDC